MPLLNLDELLKKMKVKKEKEVMEEFCNLFYIHFILRFLRYVCHVHLFHTDCLLDTKEYARTGNLKLLIIDKRFTATLDYLMSKQYEIIAQGWRFSKKPKQISLHILF